MHIIINSTPWNYCYIFLSKWWHTNTSSTDFFFCCWKKRSNATLVLFVDVLPPTFGVTCPTSPLLVFAERGMFSAQVNWNRPNATDNSGAAPSLSSNYKPPQRFSQGTHVITYTAVDQSGNRATCIFTIKVIGIKSYFLMVVTTRCLSYDILTSFIVFNVISYQLYVTDSRFRRCTKAEQLR